MCSEKMSDIKITFYGHALFLIESSKGVKIGIDPYDEQVKTPLPELSVDIVTSSHSHSDHAYFSLFKNNPKILNNPGKITIFDIQIEGIPTFHDELSGYKLGKNIIFKFVIDGIKIAHLGDLGHILSDNQVEILGNIDILMIPIGGIYTIDGDTAIDIIQKISPKIVIPMHYKENDIQVNPECITIDDFKEKISNYKEVGHKITISKNTMPEKTEIWIMSSSILIS